MAFDMENNTEFCDHVIQQLTSQAEFGDWHDLQNTPEEATFTGRRFQQNKDYAINIVMGNYLDAMTDYRMPREKAKQDKELLTAAETERFFRGIAACWPDVKADASHDAPFDNMPNHKSQRGCLHHGGRWQYDGRPHEAVSMYALGMVELTH
eukprot:1346123-Pyramimonas_sp.AAC.1